MIPENEFRGVPILYEDNHLLVVLKPPNMPTQADASRDQDLLTTMKAYIAQKYQKPGAVYLGLVHRLDRPVGGLVAIARTSKAADRLSRQVREKTLARGYLACVRGEAPEHAVLNDWLLKDAAANTVRVAEAGTPGAKDAKLAFWRCQTRESLTLLRVRLYTGRSHQIRVQLANAGLPIWGDARYGGGKSGQQIALWGAFLRLDHPITHERLAFAMPPFAFSTPWKGFTLPELFPELEDA